MTTTLSAPFSVPVTFCLFVTLKPLSNVTMIDRYYSIPELPFKLIVKGITDRLRSITKLIYGRFSVTFKHNPLLH